ncbi:unnamed protein product [Sphacelaria rigidula]
MSICLRCWQVEEDSNNAKWQRGAGSDFNSNQTFREKIRRHEYIARGPRERYARTITTVQEHGWCYQPETDRKV